MESRAVLTLVGLGLSIAAGCGGASTPQPASGAPAVVTVPAASARAPEPAGEAPAATKAPAAAGYTFDGLRIGSRFASEVMSRPPFDAPCDIDPVDHGAARIVVYGARPCRKRTFPEDTSVLFYLPPAARDEDDLDVPIETLGWMGGGYFAARSDFPLRTGEPAARAEAVLGKPARTFRLGEEEQTLDISTFGAGDVHAVSTGGKLVGFVVGKMPDDPENERWRGLLQLYYRFTVGRGER